MNPKHPIYIVSKGRWQVRPTANALTEIGVPFYMVVEDKERDAYAAHIPEDRLLVLPRRYQQEYDTFDSLGDSKSKGPGAARNFAWDHSSMRGATWHWVMDDNIWRFYRLNRNTKIPLGDGTGLRVMEDFAERYSNVAMAGPNYEHFALRKQKYPPFTHNTRIYSCNLIRNDVGFRWRGRYNEDTDLSLRMLKAGWCTILFNAFLQNKIATQQMAGGNTADFYAREGTLPKSQMLVSMHPDVARLVKKWDRWHHEVDYSRFKANVLLRRPDVPVSEGVDEYGMRLVRVEEGGGDRARHEG